MIRTNPAAFGHLAPDGRMTGHHHHHHHHHHQQSGGSQMQLPLPIRSLSHKSSFGERRYPPSDLARFSLTLNLARDDDLHSPTGSYPSPPMSGSPPTSSRRSGSPVQEEQRYAPAPTSAEARRPTVVEASPRHWESQQQQYQEQYPRYGYAPVSQPAYAQQHPGLVTSAETMRPYQPMVGQISRAHELSMAAPMHRSPFTPVPPPSYGQQLSRSNSQSMGSQRRSKAHVPSACVNCKKAHLACDVQRPCRRCVNSGKQDTCHDVQHKKRGRPRIRDAANAERQPQSPVMGWPGASPATSPTTYRTGEPSPGIRHLANTSVLTPPSSGARTGFPPPSSESPLHSGQAVALLNLDFIIAKTNAAFLSLLSRTQQSVTERTLADLIDIPDRNRVYGLKRSLEDERNRREPSFLPPIWPGGPNSRDVDAIRTLPLDSEIQGIIGQERRDSLTFLVGERTPRPFNVSLRLAKNQVYFVVMTVWPNSMLPPQSQRRESEPNLSLPPLGHPPATSAYPTSPGPAYYPTTTQASTGGRPQTSYNPSTTRSYEASAGTVESAEGYGIHPPQLPRPAVSPAAQATVLPPSPSTSQAGTSSVSASGSVGQQGMTLAPLQNFPRGEIRKRTDSHSQSGSSDAGDNSASRQERREKDGENDKRGGDRREKKRNRLDVRDVMD